jgi:2C-methyl-D-erythritol 2,4-cyclodiphosphate synthase
MVNNSQENDMPVTKEFVEQFVGLVNEVHRKTKTSVELVKIVVNGERIDPTTMFNDRQLDDLFFHASVDARVYAYVRDNQDLFVKPEPQAFESDDPVAALEQWGRKLAEDHDINLAEITYDSEMLFFIVNDRPKMNVAIAAMREAALNSGFIKLPYAIGSFALDSDVEVESGQSCYTMCFYLVEEA